MLKGPYTGLLGCLPLRVGVLLPLGPSQIDEVEVAPTHFLPLTPVDGLRTTQSPDAKRPTTARLAIGGWTTARPGKHV